MAIQELLLTKAPADSCALFQNHGLEGWMTLILSLTDQLSRPLEQKRSSFWS